MEQFEFMLGPELLIVLILILCFIAGYFYLKHLPKRTKKVDDTLLPSTEVTKTDEQKPITAYGPNRAYKAAVIRRHPKYGPSIDYTTIDNQIGDIYGMDTSCPSSGAHFIVREDDDHKIVDYDHREREVVFDQTPEYAWYATNWQILKEVFSIPLPWWKSTSTWFAIACFIGAFVSLLAAFGE